MGCALPLTGSHPMNRIIRSSILAFSVFSVLATSSISRAGMWNEQRYDFNLRADDSSDFLIFNSSFFLSNSGPQWFLNALANPGGTRTMNSRLADMGYDGAGDRTINYASSVDTQTE